MAKDRVLHHSYLIAARKRSRTYSLRNVGYMYNTNIITIIAAVKTTIFDECL